MQGGLHLQDILILKEEVLWDVNTMSPGNCQWSVDRHFALYIITGSVASN